MIPVPAVTDREFVCGTDRALPPREQCYTLERWRSPGTQLARNLVCGGRWLDLRVKPGLDELAVWRAVTAHLRAKWVPHLHKVTGVGMMLEEWTESA